MCIEQVGHALQVQGVDKAFQLNLTLTTLPFDGKVTKTIKSGRNLLTMQ